MRKSNKNIGRRIIEEYELKSEINNLSLRLKSILGELEGEQEAVPQLGEDINQIRIIKQNEFILVRHIEILERLTKIKQTRSLSFTRLITMNNLGIKHKLNPVLDTIPESDKGR